MSEMLPLAEELSLVYARMSGVLLSDQTVQTALQLVTSLALDTIPGASGAGVTLLDVDGRRTSAAATSDLVDEADRLQYELDEGPCLTACAERRLIRIDDFAEEARWPRWTEVALPLGLRSSLSVPMMAPDRVLGAVKVYGEQPNAFAAASEPLLTRFAAQATILLANVQSLEQAERLSDSLQQALRARNVIATATGILMERFGLSEEQAFLRLVAAAGQGRQELVDEAAAVVAGSPREPE